MGVDNQNGFALVLVLWMSLLMAVIAGSLLQEIRKQHEIAASEVGKFELQLNADGAINQAILNLLTQPNHVHWRIDGTPITIMLGDQPVTVAVASQVGRIDINTAPSVLLRAIMETAGVSISESNVLAERIIEWRSSGTAGFIDQAAASYKSSGRLYGPRHKPFRSVGELRLVLGMTDEVQEKIGPLLTVYNGSSNIDLGVADEDVLRVLANSGDRFAAAQLAARSTDNAAGLDRAPGQGEPLCLEARAERGPTLSIRKACIRLQNAGDLPYEVLSWN